MRLSPLWIRFVYPLDAFPSGSIAIGFRTLVVRLYQLLARNRDLGSQPVLDECIAKHVVGIRAEPFPLVNSNRRERRRYGLHEMPADGCRPPAPALGRQAMNRVAREVRRVGSGSGPLADHRHSFTTLGIALGSSAERRHQQAGWSRPKALRPAVHLSGCWHTRSTPRHRRTRPWTVDQCRTQCRSGTR